MEEKESLLFDIASGMKSHPIEMNEEFIQVIKGNNIIDPLLKSYPNLVIRNRNWENLFQIKDKHLKELTSIIEEFENNKVRYLMIKGLALTKYYQEDLPRQSNDYDFVVKDIGDFWICHDILERRGYYTVINQIFTKHEGKIKGIIKYEKQIDSNTKINLEINISGFIIAEVTWLDSDTIWKQTQKHTYKGLEFNIPDDSMSLIILVIETSDRKKFFMRDVIDYYFITRFGNIDWQYVNSVLKDSYLLDILRKLREISATFESGTFKFIYKKAKGRQREFKHILPYILSEKHRMKKIYMLLLKFIGEEFSSRDRILGIIRKFDKILSPRKRFEYGIVTHFILMNSNVKGNWKWLKYKKYHILTTPIGTYWATNFAILEEDEEQDIKEFISSIKE